MTAALLLLHVTVPPAAVSLDAVLDGVLDGSSAGSSVVLDGVLGGVSTAAAHLPPRHPLTEAAVVQAPGGP